MVTKLVMITSSFGIIIRERNKVKARFFPRNSSLAKAKAEEGDHDHHNGGGGRCENKGIEKIFSQRHRRKCVCIILHGRSQGKKAGNVLRVVGTVAFYRGQDHPVKRKQYDQRPQGEQNVSDHADCCMSSGSRAFIGKLV